MFYFYCFKIKYITIFTWSYFFLSNLKSENNNSIFEIPVVSSELMLSSFPNDDDVQLYLWSYNFFFIRFLEHNILNILIEKSIQPSIRVIFFQINFWENIINIEQKNFCISKNQCTRTLSDGCYIFFSDNDFDRIKSGKLSDGGLREYHQISPNSFIYTWHIYKT